MKKTIISIFILSLNLAITTQCTQPTIPKWLSGKIKNNTTVPVEIKVNYILNCDKVTPVSERSKCIESSAYTLILALEPRDLAGLSDINFVKNKFQQCNKDATHGKNSIHVRFPAAPGTKTYAPISVTIPDSDLEKTPKTYNINAVAGTISIK